MTSWPAKQRVLQPTSLEGQWKWCVRQRKITNTIPDIKEKSINISGVPAAKKSLALKQEQKINL